MPKRVAVIGAGVVGLATAWALERRGFACLVFEQGAPGGGQSAGESRIFRHSHRDPRQFELAIEARGEWAHWEEEFGVQLISQDGAMVIGQEAVERLRGYSGDSGISVRELDSVQLKEALPPMAEFVGPAMIDESAGAIRTQLTLANLIGAAGLNLIPERIESVIPRPDGGVDVIGSLGTRTFDAVVVAAGTSTADLASSAGVDIPVSTRAHVRLTMPVAGPNSIGRLACLQDSSGAFGESAAYGSPVWGNRHYAVGLPLTVNSDSIEERQRLVGQMTDRTADYIRRAFPGLDVSRSNAIQRWVTELPWATDGLAIWQQGDAFFVAGHNLFKLAPVLGKALSRAVSAGSVESGFRPGDRLGKPVSETAGPAG